MGCCRSSTPEHGEEEYDEDFQAYNQKENSANYNFNNRGENQNEINKAKQSRQVIDNIDKEDFSEVEMSKSKVQSIKHGKIENLLLTIKESKFNTTGTVLKISTDGLENTTRLNKDGCVYFGLNCEEFSNDFFFQPEEGIAKQHFVIKYFEKFNNYMVKNINGSGIFLRIQKKCQLNNGIIISFGTNHLVVSIQEENEVNNIQFKCIYGSNKGKD